MRISQEIMDAIREVAPIDKIVGRYVDLRKSGRNLKGICPFHHEKTPSFYVLLDEGKPRWRCWGCDAKGDVVDFLMKIKGGEFLDVVEELAVTHGIMLPGGDDLRKTAERRRDVRDQVRQAMAWFREQLLVNKTALAYLDKRGIDMEWIGRLGLGWCPPTGFWPYFDRDLAVEAGIAKVADDTGRAYCQFANRITFPILNRKGQVISFIGRTIAGQQPKYMLGHNSTIYEASKALYFLRDQTNGPVFVVEGPMDVAALAKAGMRGVSAFGTSITSDQMDLIWKMDCRPTIMLDGDDAGRRATLSVIAQAVPHLGPEKSLRVIMLPQGEDPDSLSEKEGAVALHALAKNSLDVVEAIYRLTANDQTGWEGRATHLSRAQEVLSRCKDFAFRLEMLREVNALHKGRPFREQETVRKAEQADGLMDATRIMAAVLLRHPNVIPTVMEFLGNVPVHVTSAGQIIDKMRELNDEYDGEDIVKIIKKEFPFHVEDVLSEFPLPLPDFASASATEKEAIAGFHICYQQVYRASVQRDLLAAMDRAKADPSKDNIRLMLGLKEEMTKVGGMRWN